jgi:drug/metabolite transporter (DMT)-like permease
MLEIVSTLMRLTPIFLLPIVYFVFKENVTQRAVVGTVIALVGVSVLMIRQAGFFKLIFNI